MKAESRESGGASRRLLIDRRLSLHEGAGERQNEPACWRGEGIGEAGRPISGERRREMTSPASMR